MSVPEEGGGGASSGAHIHCVQADISPGSEGTNWACPEQSHFTERQVGMPASVSLFQVDVPAQQHAGYVYKRTICLSDSPPALQPTSHSERRPRYQIHGD